MTEFKVGDCVTCIDPGVWDETLTKGKTYIVKATDGPFVSVVDDSSSTGNYKKDRFEAGDASEVLFLVDCPGEAIYRAALFSDVKAYCAEKKHPCKVYKIYATVSPVKKLEIRYTT